MKSDYALILFYRQNNRYSFNAIAGAIESDPHLIKLNTFFVQTENEIIENIPVLLLDHKKIIIGISFTTTQLWDTIDLLKKIKLLDKNKIILIAGGPHPTGEPLETLKIGFDIVVRGEGEETFTELLKRIIIEENYNDVKGIAYINQYNEYVFTGNRNWLVPDNYSPISEYFSKYGPIEITRGCPFACSYCQTSRLFGVVPRHRSVENILHHAKIMCQHNLNDFRVITPNAFSYGSVDGKNINYNQLEKLLSSVRELLGKKGRIFFGSFPSEVRPEHVTNDTVSLITRYANNDNLVIGAQAGSQRMLDLINRGHNIQSIYNSVDVTLHCGLKANVDFIFGLPGETDDDISITLEMVKKLGKIGAKIHAHTFMPLPQTPLSNKRGRKISPSLRKDIHRLCSSGILYGEWQKQEKYSEKIISRRKLI